jgi:hypothetical protein
MLSNNLTEYGKFAQFFYLTSACANKPRIHTPLISPPKPLGLFITFFIGVYTYYNYFALQQFSGCRSSKFQ